MRFCVLRSGSSGNCTLIEQDGCRILIDAGMSQKRIREVLEEAGTDAGNIAAIVCTHLHADHVNYSTLQICRKFEIPLWVHEHNIPVLKAAFAKKHIANLSINSFLDSPFAIGPLVLQPFEISHDANAVTSGFGIRPGSERENFLTYAADLGYFPDSLIPFFTNSRAIILEANHDPELLWKNPRRPYIHKRRVSGNSGHLSNDQAAQALIKTCRVSTKNPQAVVLCHLSGDHNSPQLATDTIGTILEKEELPLPLSVAQRHECTPFFEII